MNNKPNIRFNGFNGDWKTDKLGNHLKEYSNRDAEGIETVAVGKNGIKSRKDIYSTELSNDTSKNKVISKNTLTIGMGSKQIDVGILHDDCTYSVSPAYHTFKIENVYSRIVENFFSKNNNTLSNEYMVIGARQGKTVDINSLLDAEIKIPSSEEQKDINEFFNLLNKKIILEERKLEKLKLAQKSLQHKMSI